MKKPAKATAADVVKTAVKRVIKPAEPVSAPAEAPGKPVHMGAARVPEESRF